MTLIEFLAAQRGWLRSQGLLEEEKQSELDLEWYEDLMRQVDEKEN